MELACNCPVVVCCRCSPQQKADIVNLLKKHTGKRTCAIGKTSNNQRLEKCVRCVLLLFNWDLRVFLADHLLQTWSLPRTFEIPTIKQLEIV